MVRLESPVVAALPRGAVIVAIEIAERLSAPLIVIPVEEIYSPGSPEYVVGAVAENTLHVIDSDALAALGVVENALATRVAEATARYASREQTYRGGREEIGLKDRSVVLVDDGSASVPVIEGAALSLRRHNIGEVLLASPLPPTVLPSGVDRVIGPGRDSGHAADISLIGGWFDDASAPSDAQAAALADAYAPAPANAH